MNISPQRSNCSAAYLRLEETEWFECKHRQPLGYVREPRFLVASQYEEMTVAQAWTGGKQWEPANAAVYRGQMMGYMGSSLRTTNPTSLRQGPVQSLPYMEFPMTKQHVSPRLVRHPDIPSTAKVCSALPSDQETASTQAEDNTNKPVPQSPAKSRKPPQQQLLKLPTVNKAPRVAKASNVLSGPSQEKLRIQQHISDFSFLKPSTENTEVTTNPDFDTVLATAVQEPSPCPVSTSQSETLTSRPAAADLFYCPVPNCGKNYRKKCRVVEHMRRRHDKEGTPMFRCQETKCELTFEVLDELKVHQRNKGHLKSYEILLNSDKKVEGGTEPEPVKKPKTEEINSNLRYQCAICAKTYSTKYRRDAHAALCTGNGDKVFCCPYPGCGKAYATKDSLTRHAKKNPHGETVTETKEMEAGKQEKLAKETPAEYHDRVQELVDLFDEI